MLESRQLRCFLAVAEDLHFGRAADRLGVAQSALSAQVQRLEAELGVRLLNRRKRAAVTLTDAGQLFLAEAGAAWAQLQRAEHVGRLAARGDAGEVRLGYVASALTSGLLTDTLKAFRQAHAGVRMRIVPMETPRQIESLADGLLDVGLMRPRPQYPEGVAAELLRSEPLEIAMAAEHPLAARPSLRAQDLKNETFIVPQFNETAGFGDNLRRLGALGGYAIEPACAVNDFVTAASMACAGYGIVLAPRSLKNFAPGGLVFRRVEGFDDEVRLVMAYRLREPAPAVQALLRVARGLAADSEHSRENNSTSRSI
ncbi:LysR family transcriptional regulator [Azohydromonas aeria]|uniref:LysR family transcriptional regulator n=1 Tax=Azohydromonas aeria TaxID=2590212 RepID=UPI0012FA8A0F|nr:LysR substrate-binding domain-containing protein [Azohydromonas aeria]